MLSASSANATEEIFCEDLSRFSFSCYSNFYKCEVAIRFPKSCSIRIRRTSVVRKPLYKSFPCINSKKECTIQSHFMRSKDADGIEEIQFSQAYLSSKDSLDNIEYKNNRRGSDRFCYTNVE